MQPLTPAIAAELRDAVALVRSGNPAGARARAEAALKRHGGHGALHAFLGTLCCRLGDPAAGIPHLRTALRLNPQDLTIATNLTAALIDRGSLAEAAEICTEARAAADPSLHLQRLRAYLLQQRGEHEAAAAAYRRIVAAAPADCEAWNNLGNALAAAGQPEAAVDALGQAARLEPASAPIQLNYAATLAQLGRLDEADAVLRATAERHPADPKPLIELAALLRHRYRDIEALAVLERAVALVPGDAALRVQLGEERMAAFRLGDARQAFLEAVAIDPANGPAHVQLALLLEHMNREAELPERLAEARSAGVDPGSLRFIELLACRREKRFAEGLALLPQVPAEIEPIRRAQIEGELRDRLGDADGAFAAFTRMNRLFADDPSDPVRRAESARASLAAERAAVTPSWLGGWSPTEPAPSRPAPVFLVGFPRSGTTLLDTMLMGHPAVQVLEERPPLSLVEKRIGGLDRLPRLTAEEIEAARDHYWEEAAACIDLRPDSLLIDKAPLHMNKVPLIHRLWPDARFILALRHPLDVVLSCFITSFRLNDWMANFIDLRTAAELYDLSFSHWTNCTAIMPVAVRAVRYEKMIEDPEAELRPVIDSLDLDWDSTVIDHRSTARSRGTISTASYAQVTEGLYRRAAGRWERYRAHLEPVLPILAPWAARLGYRV